MYQRSLLPLAIIAEIPRHGENKYGQVIASNNLTYLFKPWINGDHTPTIEYTCYTLARICGIATPGFAALSAQRHSLGFGSEIKTEISPITSKGSGKMSAITRTYGAATYLSALWIFDLFIHNPDRHPQNILICDQAGNDVLYAIDFANSLFHSGWPIGDRLPYENTDHFYSAVFKTLTFNQREAMRVLQCLNAISTERLRQEVIGYVPWETEELDNLASCWDRFKHERITRIQHKFWNSQHATITLFPGTIQAK